MITTVFREIAAKHSLTVASGMAYGMLNGCFITLSEAPDLRRISIYVGPQEAPAPGCTESYTVSCAKQLLSMISTASGSDNVYSLMTGNAAIPALVLNHAGSVVTVNFPDAPEARAGIERFIGELLPMAARLTRPQLCIYCGAPTEGKGCPVRLSSDTVVPMHLPCLKQAAGQHTPSAAEQNAQKRSIAIAAVCALLAALLFALMYGLGPAGWIPSGVLLGLAPFGGYVLSRGKSGLPRIATVAGCAVAAAVLGSLGATYAALHGDYLRNLTVMTAQSISEWAFIRASLSASAEVLPAAALRLMTALFTAAFGCTPLLYKASTATAEAGKPKRLKGLA